MLELHYESELLAHIDDQHTYSNQSLLESPYAI